MFLRKMRILKFSRLVVDLNAGWILRKSQKTRTKLDSVFIAEIQKKRPIVSCNSAQVGSEFSAGEYLDVYLS